MKRRPQRQKRQQAAKGDEQTLEAPCWAEGLLETEQNWLARVEIPKRRVCGLRSSECKSRVRILAYNKPMQRQELRVAAKESVQQTVFLFSFWPCFGLRALLFRTCPARSHLPGHVVGGLCRWEFGGSPEAEERGASMEALLC